MRSKTQRKLQTPNENMYGSENEVYPQWNSHLVGIMISKTIGYNGVPNIFRQTHMYGSENDKPRNLGFCNVLPLDPPIIIGYRYSPSCPQPRGVSPFHGLFGFPKVFHCIGLFVGYKACARDPHHVLEEHHAGRTNSRPAEICWAVFRKKMLGCLMWIDRF